MSYLETTLLLGDAVHSVAALSIVQKTERLISTIDVDHIWKFQESSSYEKIYRKLVFEILF